MMEFWLAEIALQLAAVVELRRFECGLDEAREAATTDEMEAAVAGGRLAAARDDEGSGRRYHVVRSDGRTTPDEQTFDSWEAAEQHLETLPADYRLYDYGDDGREPATYEYDRQEGRAVPAR
jgi:hypothetical protein